jgi:hypothetical protein
MAARTTYLERYLAGEHEPVWAELQALGAAVRAEPLYSDALAVAHDTPSRHTLVEWLTAPMTDSRIGEAANYNTMVRHRMRPCGECARISNGSSRV